MVAPRFDQFGGRLSASQIAAGNECGGGQRGSAVGGCPAAPECRALPYGSFCCDPLHRGSGEGFDLTPDRNVQGRRRTARGLERVSITSQQEPPRDHSGTLCPGWPPSG